MTRLTHVRTNVLSVTHVVALIVISRKRPPSKHVYNNAGTVVQNLG